MKLRFSFFQVKRLRATEVPCRALPGEEGLLQLLRGSFCCNLPSEDALFLWSQVAAGIILHLQFWSDNCCPY